MLGTRQDEAPLPRTRVVNGRDYAYINVTPSGTRMIGGSCSYLAESDNFVFYHSGFPRLVVSFSPFDFGGLRSRIIRRKNTWQATLPTAKLGFPDGIDLRARQTHQPTVFDDDGRFEMDLAWVAAGDAAPERPAPGEAPGDKFPRAKSLVYHLGELIRDDPGLADRVERELGVRLLPAGA